MRQHKKGGVGKAVKSYYITAVLIVFFLGFLLGWFYNDSSLDETKLLLEESQLNIDSFNYALLFSEELNVSMCNLEMIDYMEDILFKTGQELISLEETSNDFSEEYSLLKQKHNINQVLFYTYYRDYYFGCEDSEDMILFFFNSSQLDDSNNQGEILNSIVEQYDVRVLAMDYDYTERLDFFYDFYDTQSLPTLVINYDEVRSGFVSYDELETILLAYDE